MNKFIVLSKNAGHLHMEYLKCNINLVLGNVDCNSKIRILKKDENEKCAKLNENFHNLTV